MMVLHGKQIYLYQISLFKRPWTFLFTQPHLSLPAVRSSDKSKCSTCILETDTFPFDPLLGFIWFLFVCFFLFLFFFKIWKTSQWPSLLYAFVNHFIRTFRSLTYCGEKHLFSHESSQNWLCIHYLMWSMTEWRQNGLKEKWKFERRIRLVRLNNEKNYSILTKIKLANLLLMVQILVRNWFLYALILLYLL